MVLDSAGCSETEIERCVVDYIIKNTPYHIKSLAREYGQLLERIDRLERFLLPDHYGGEHQFDTRPFWEQLKAMKEYQRAMESRYDFKDWEVTIIELAAQQRASMTKENSDSNP